MRRVSRNHSDKGKGTFRPPSICFRSPLTWDESPQEKDGDKRTTPESCRGGLENVEDGGLTTSLTRPTPGVKTNLLTSLPLIKLEREEGGGVLVIFCLRTHLRRRGVCVCRTTTRPGSRPNPPIFY